YFKEAIAQAAANKRPPPDEADVVRWGNVDLPIETATLHFGLVGTTGSGKTTLLLILLKSIIPHLKPGNNRRMLIYDAKRDIMSVLSGLKPLCPVVTLHPFDVRGAAWHMAEDIQDAGTAMEIATILIPEEENKRTSTGSKFFTEAAR